ncbi:MAG: LysM peptidoglycan-binding domain-containing protein [Candidatus Aminicenantes bacterium]|nr:LysM peptidoglycan-binding domain-containing protein [Candidatus Aminicenantes bacterium]
MLALRAAEGADVDARDLRVVPPAERPAPEDVLFYTVQAGDSLGAIAGRFLGRPGLWPRIFEANRGALESAHDISPGQVLAIPIYGSRLAAAPPKKHSE